MKKISGTITSSDVTIKVAPFRQYIVWLDGAFSSNIIALQGLKSDGSYGTFYNFTESEGVEARSPSGTIRLSPSAPVTVSYEIVEISADPKDVSEVQPEVI